MRGRMALLLGLAMLPAGAIAMQVGLNAAAARQAAYEESLGRRAVQALAAERTTFDEVREMLRVLSAAPAVREIRSVDCRGWLEEVIERYPYIAGIQIIGEDGRLQCSAPHATEESATPLLVIVQLARTRDAFAMGFVPRDFVTLEPALVAVEPIRHGNRRVGFVRASISVDELRRLLDTGGDIDGYRAALADSTGRLFVESSPPASGATAGLPSADDIRNHFGPAPSFVPVKGGAAVIAPLHPPDLYAVMSWAIERPSWRRWADIAASIAAPLLIWMLAIGAGWVAIEVFVARPLSSLEAAARGYARGEDVPDPPELQSAPDEIRTLRRTLAAMAKTLRGREQRLVEALAEERALLREVHHRVKNNLQMVSSLLNIQARGAHDENEAKGLARAHDRVQLLALVHQRIYASGELRELRLDDLVADIARHLLQSRGLANSVALNLNLAESRVVADRAVPLAFLIGESVSTALDALRAAGPVELRLDLVQDPNGETRFAVDASVTGQPARNLGPGPRLIDAFAGQLGASVGRDSERAYPIWVCVPARPH